MRLEVDRLPAAGGVAGRGDRARDLRPLELVGEDPGRLPRPGLDARRRRARRARARAAGTPRRARSTSVRSRRRAAGVRTEAVVTCGSFCRGAEDDARIEVESRAGRTGTRRSACAQASTTASSVSRGASGIVTSTMSGFERSSSRSSSARRSEHLDALDAAPAEVRVVVDEADHPLARRLAQLAHQAAARCGRRRRSASAGPCGRAPSASRSRASARRTARRRSRPCRSARR